MEGASSYIEVYVYTDNRRNLQSRIINMKTLTEVFEEMQGKRFDIVLIQSRCIIGNGTYDYTGDSIVTEYENGAVSAFLSVPSNSKTLSWNTSLHLRNAKGRSRFATP